MLKLMTTAGGLVVGAQALSMNMKVTKLEVAQEGKPVEKPQSKDSAKPKTKGKATPKAQAPSRKEKQDLATINKHVKSLDKKNLNICDGIQLKKGVEGAPDDLLVFFKATDETCYLMAQHAPEKFVGMGFRAKRNNPDTDGSNVFVKMEYDELWKPFLDGHGRPDESSRHSHWVDKCCAGVDLDKHKLLGQKICEGMDGKGTDGAQIIDPIPAAAEHCPNLGQNLEARDAKDKSFSSYAYNVKTYSLSKEFRNGEYKTRCCKEKDEEEEEDPLLKFVGQNICLGLKDEALPQFETPENSDANCAATAKQVSLSGTWKKKEKAEVKFTQEDAGKPDPKQEQEQLTKRWVEGCCEKQETQTETTNTKKGGNKVKEDEGSCGGDDGSCR